jgi:hypothetical protein
MLAARRNKATASCNFERLSAILSVCRTAEVTMLEYDVCDVTLSVHPHRASWKQWKVCLASGHGGNRTRDLWWLTPTHTNNVGIIRDNYF